VSINFEEYTLNEILEMIEKIQLQETCFDNILTEKVKEGKMVFSGSMSELLH